MFNLSQIIQIITDPTRVTSTTESFIDHILCNKKENISQSGVIPLGIIDHFMIFCSRKILKCYFNKHKTVKIRYLKHY